MASRSGDNADGSPASDSALKQMAVGTRQTNCFTLIWLLKSLAEHFSTRTELQLLFYSFPLSETSSAREGNRSSMLIWTLAGKESDSRLAMRASAGYELLQHVGQEHC